MPADGPPGHEQDDTPPIEPASGGLQPRGEDVAVDVDPAVLDVVRRIWGFDTLRARQAEAIAAGVEGRDALVVLPTGGGKSLCYQVPPLVTGRLHVVVSPLISLMKDQVDGLVTRGYPTGALHSAMSEDERRATVAALDDGTLRLLYVSPERLALDGFRAQLVRAGVSTFAIDEAHCISHWGHDFRQDYRQLENLRHIFPEAAVQAFTATATPAVREDVIRQLDLRDPAVLIASFDRPNLTYRMQYRDELTEQVATAVQRHAGEGSIVYCISRKDTERLAEQLVSRGIDAAPYHAGLPNRRRIRVQDAFSAEQQDVVVATVAFGMGIDRSNVRCVVHAAMPKSIDAYQQETGRAGRDGLAAECLLLHGWADVERWRRLAERAAEETGAGPEALAVHAAHLDDMIRLCGTPSCRRATILEHFGESWDAVPCGACDVCLGEIPELEGGTDLARKVLSGVYRLDQRFGVGHLVDMLRGRATETVKRWSHDSLSTFGILSGLPARRLKHLVHQMVYLGLLERSAGDRPIVRLGRGAREVLRGEREVQLFEPPGAVRVTADGGDEWSGVDRDLFEQLRALRRTLATEAGVPAYVVFNDRTLRECAAAAPTSREAMLRIHGVGEKTYERYGEAFLDLIREQAGAGDPAVVPDPAS